MNFEPQPFGKYYLLEKIATGGMAEIFKAKTFGVVGFEKLLAIKRILPHLSQNSDFIAMLIDEAKIAVQLNHMNIVQVYDLGKIEDDYFIAMEYIQGKDLRSIMRRCEDKGIRISVENAVYIIVEICKGLDYAHRKKDQFGLSSGIVHRDISPQNILISYEGEVKIVDFGIAKAARKATETDAGVLKGKFAYMSPEQARGEEVDQRTDIFSTGIILYELLTGERLFYSDNNLQTLERIKKFSIEPPFLPPHIPSELEFILIQALENDPNARYATANDLQVDLAKFLYSSAMDFTSKHLAELMRNLFDEAEGTIDRGLVPENEPNLDTKTKLLISQANQEVLVTREEDLTPAGGFHRPNARKMRRPKQALSVPPSPRELFQKPKDKKGRGGWIKVVGLMAVLVFAYLFRDFIGDKVRIVFKQVSGFLGQTTKPGAGSSQPLSDLSSIYVETVPSGAKVYFDNREMDELTPVWIRNVEPRKDHLIMFSLQNYETQRVTANTEPKQILKIKKELDRERGKLFVDSKPPGASVYLNGEMRGTTPQEFDEIDANVDLAVKVTKNGYVEKFDVIRVQASQTKIIQYALQRKTVELGAAKVNSFPAGASMILNGQEVDEKTPTVLKDLEVGTEYTLIFRLDGYQDQQITFRVEAGMQVLERVYLKANREKLD